MKTGRSQLTESYSQYAPPMPDAHLTSLVSVTLPSFVHDLFPAFLGCSVRAATRFALHRLYSSCQHVSASSVSTKALCPAHTLLFN